MEVNPRRVTPIITSGAATELGLRPGDTATALIKATSVMITK